MESLRLAKRPRPTGSVDDGDECDSDRESVYNPDSEVSPTFTFPTLIPDDEANEGKRESAQFIAVTRRERAILMVIFRREQRFARQAYVHQLRTNFKAEVADGREHRSTVFFPTEEECLAEAWENYLFDYLIQYDEDQAHLLVSFRSTMAVQPQHPSDFDRAQSLARTTLLWEGLRRVYFGEQELDSPPREVGRDSDPSPTHDQVVDALSTEIIALEQRAALARLRASASTCCRSMRSLLPLLHVCPLALSLSNLPNLTTLAPIIAL